jgi:hypothetical protein
MMNLICNQMLFDLELIEWQVLLEWYRKGRVSCSGVFDNSLISVRLAMHIWLWLLIINDELSTA